MVVTRTGAGALLALMLGASAAWAAPMALGVKSASVEVDELSGKPILQIEMTQEAQRAFTKLTTRHLNQVLNLLIDGEVVSSPRIMSPIQGSSVVISGDFTSGELRALAQRLSEGNAVVEVELASE